MGNDFDTKTQNCVSVAVNIYNIGTWLCIRNRNKTGFLNKNRF